MKLANRNIMVILLFSFFGKAQNLVPNSNFSIYSSCPIYMNQIKLATGWDSASATPDYFNACYTGSSTGVSVPNNGYGHQKDCAGSGEYAGIFAFNKPVQNQSREYINCKLTDTLKPSHRYVAGMYVNLCDKSDYAIGTMGMYFSATKIYSPNVNTGLYINIPNPQVKSTIVLSDTVNWMAVRDTFTAQGGETYVTIGNFSSDAQSDTTFLYPNIFNGVSYYYIDSVTVFDTGLLGVNEIKNQEPKLNIYPNPALDAISLNIIGISNYQKSIVIIQNTLGEIVKKIPFEKNIDVSDLAQGCYFLQTTLPSGETYKTKFLKQ